MVITGLTRNQLGSNPPRVRISPSPPEKPTCFDKSVFQLYSPCGERYAPSVRDICFASDMPAGVCGEYNITAFAKRNITTSKGSNITSAKWKYHFNENCKAKFGESKGECLSHASGEKFSFCIAFL